MNLNKMTEYRNDILVREYYVNDYDERNGLYKEWDNNGKLRLEANYKNDELHGHYIKYEDEKVSKDIWYSNGKIDGKYKSYWDNGNPYVEIEYEDGKMNGKFTAYYPDGSIKKEGYNKEDKKVGIWKSYYENGQIRVEENYIKGVQEGRYRKWYDNGQLEAEGTYERNYLEGTFTTYYKNGKLKSKGELKKFLEDGTWLEYDEKGHGVKKVYEKGKVINESLIVKKKIIKSKEKEELEL